MCKLSRNSSIDAGSGKTPKQDERVPSWQASSGWQRFAYDSLLAIAGIALVTAAIMIIHLYPRLPSIVLTYLLVIIGLAWTRGRYAALLAALLASLSLDLLLTPSPEVFISIKLEDLLDPEPFIFLIIAIITGLLISALRRHAEQARRRERETRLLAEQAQEIATLQERQRLAHKLHDSVSQALYGISLGARTAREALSNDPGEAIAPLDYVITLSERALAEMRALFFELRPEALLAEGVITTLTNQVAVIRTHYKLSVNAELSEEPALSLQDKQVLCCIAQEALHNIIKHAGASTVTLRLARQGNELILEVGDDGRGFDPTGPFPGHFGIYLMRERAARLGGTCTIRSSPSQGTHLCVRIPIHDNSGSAEEKSKRQP